MEKLLLKLATSETGFANALGGMSEQGTEKMCGYVFEYANTKEELVSEVVSYAEDFEEFAQGVRTLMEDDEVDSDVDWRDDITAISSLIEKYKKGIDLQKIKALAAEHWMDIKEST